MHPLERYLTELRDLYLSGAGVPETSGYPALKALLDEVGKTFKPRTRCIIHPKGAGAGLPDGGLYTSDQFPQRAHEPREGTLPSAGVIEAKAVSESLSRTLASEQVNKYLVRYGQVLVTNYREFVLLVRTTHDGSRKADTFSLAESEEAFWRLAAQPRKAAEERGERFVEFLTRVLRSRARLSDPEDVAWFLASYARDAMDAIEGQDLPALATIRKAFEEALGITFQGEQGDHFFRSSLIQTLFYGIFSGWVLWSREHPPTDLEVQFDWKDAAWYLKVPAIEALFGQIAQPGPMRNLGLGATLDRTADVLNRVDRADFFRQFQSGEAVQYFYEPFLEAFDPALRKELGVWYTPREIVQYMVARVDTVLREELGIARGLADPRVYVLDPCCGTGAYLVEVLRTIANTLKSEGGDALVANDLRKAAMERVFGFEILPAPFVVAHLQLGLLLQTLGAPLGSDSRHRAAVYLTNALTGWDTRPDTPLPFPELAQERDLAEDVKLAKPILVILGNPPYNGFAGVTESEEERRLTEAYKRTIHAPKPQGQGLNDLYVRFFRMAERKIVEHTGRGVICFISNYSWLDGLSFTGMRERYLEAFNRIWIDNLHGDRMISEYAPDGSTSETIFAQRGTSPGIKIGTAATLLVRVGKDDAQSELYYRDWETGSAEVRRAELVGSLGAEGGGSTYSRLEPEVVLGLPFKIARVGPGYLRWPKIPEILPASFPGVKTSRDSFVIDIDRGRLEERVRTYLDPGLADEEARRRFPEAFDANSRYSPLKVRGELLRKGFIEAQVVRYCYRPFDLRWLYWEPETKLLDEKRDDYVPHVKAANLWIEARQRQPQEEFDRGYVVRVLGDNFGNGLSSFFPLSLASRHADNPLLSIPGGANLSAVGLTYLNWLQGEPTHLFLHAVAILNSSAYRRENAGALRQDWPRIPLPATLADLRGSASLGGQLADLFDPETDTAGVSGGTPRADLAMLGVLAAVEGIALDPSEGHLGIRAGWGRRGNGGATMPSSGRFVEHPDGSLDIYLNERAYWANVPGQVWDYTISGYQVLKKWLSYRESELLGRDLTPEEARYVTEMVRRIAAILALGPALDENYERVKAGAYAWEE